MYEVSFLLLRTEGFRMLHRAFALGRYNAGKDCSYRRIIVRKVFQEIQQVKQVRKVITPITGSLTLTGNVSRMDVRGCFVPEWLV